MAEENKRQTITTKSKQEGENGDWLGESSQVDLKLSGCVLVAASQIPISVNQWINDTVRKVFPELNWNQRTAGNNLSNNTKPTITLNSSSAILNLWACDT